VGAGAGGADAAATLVVQLEATSVTEAGVEELRRAMPGTQPK
jgi:hypothetical protein